MPRARWSSSSATSRTRSPSSSTTWPTRAARSSSRRRRSLRRASRRSMRSCRTVRPLPRRLPLVSERVPDVDVSQQVCCRARACRSSPRCPSSRSLCVLLSLPSLSPASSHSHAALASQVSNTINQVEHMKQAQGKLEIMDISPVLAESIRRVRPSLSLLAGVQPADAAPHVRRHTTASRSPSCSSRADEAQRASWRKRVVSGRRGGGGRQAVPRTLYSICFVWSMHLIPSALESVSAESREQLM